MNPRWTTARRGAALLLYPVLGAVALGAAPGAREAAARTYQSERHAFTVTPIVAGLEHPWAVAFLPGDRFLVTERPGRLRLVAEGRLHPEPIAGLPAVAAHGQGGLLDVALHPQFAANRWVYLSYAASGAGGIGTEVARGRLEGHHLADVSVIFRALPKSSGGQHFGSRLLFDTEGYLYITLGDRGARERAQDLGDHAGSIIRLHDDGRVPADNPFRDRPGARPEIYTHGNRNVQGIALEPATGRVWAHEHGPQGGDEVNIVRPGVNYGWPVITYGRNYGTGTPIGEGTAKPGMAQPVLQWTPSIAPSGMTFYAGDAFPGWRGDLFVGALKFRLIVRLEIEGDRVVHEERLLRDQYGRIRDVRTGPDGHLYFLTDAAEGILARITPAPPQ